MTPSMKRILSAALLIAGIAHAQSGAIRSNAGFSSKVIPANDDGSAPIADLGFTINFFGKLRSQAYPNNNGNITFDNSLATYTPFGLTSTQREIIAPFFADVDTRGPHSKLVTYGRDTVNGHNAFAANFVNVGYYNSHDEKLNSFQVVLIDRSDLGSGNFDIEFNYARISWETGDASGGVNGYGGVPAVVGWSNGTGADGTFYQFDGSLIPGAFLDSNPTGLIHRTQNGTQVGRILSRARGGKILPPLGIIGTCPLPPATVNSAYTDQFNAVGGATNLRWSLLADPGASLPPGLTVTAGGVYSGIPTSPGTYEFTIQLIATTEDGDQTVTSRCSLTVLSPQLRITNTCPLPSATLGRSYSQALQVNGGRTPYTWSLTPDSISLPPGMFLSTGGNLSGTPLLDGAYPVTFHVTSNPNDGPTSATKTCNIIVTVPVVPFTSACSLAPATAGVPYGQALTVNGGAPPYAWLPLSLPAGLTLSPDGTISGIPQSAGPSQLVAQVIDSNGQRITQSCGISISQPHIAVSTTCPLPVATVGQSYSQRISGAGGTAPYSFSTAGGNLPSGLTLKSDGTISGMPVAAGPSNFRLLVSDSAGQPVSQSCSLAVKPSAYRLSVCPVNATAGAPLSYTFQVDGGQRPYIFSGGNLPPGLSLNSFGILSGRPTKAGTYPFNVNITDGGGHVSSEPCSAVVGASPVQITGTCPLPTGRVGVPYTAPAFKVTGGTPPYSLIQEGALLPGLVLGADGIVRGTPVSTGAADFNVFAFDSQGVLNGMECMLSVSLPTLPTVSLSLSQSGNLAASATGPTATVTLNQAYSLPIQGTVTLTNTPDTGDPTGQLDHADPRVRFVNGKSTFDFTLAAGQKQASMQIASTGTVAATVTVAVTNLTANGQPVAVVPPPSSFHVNRSIPILTTACYTTTSDGLSAAFTGYSTTRQLTSAAFSFSPSTGSSQDVTVDLTSSSFQYFASDGSIRNGGAFTLNAPFTVQGMTAVSSVKYSVSNSQGATAQQTLTKCQ
jgi:large repetitive protein